MNEFNPEGYMKAHLGHDEDGRCIFAFMTSDDLVHPADREHAARAYQMRQVGDNDSKCVFRGHHETQNQKFVKPVHVDRVPPWARRTAKKNGGDW